MQEERYVINRTETPEFITLSLYDKQTRETKIISAVNKNVAYQYGHKTVYKVKTLGGQIYVAHDPQLSTAYVWITEEDWDRDGAVEQVWKSQWRAYTGVEDVKQWLGVNRYCKAAPVIIEQFEAVF